MEKITTAERKFLDYQYGLGGSFYNALVTVILRADEINSALLAQGYPELVEVVRRFHKEHGYWEDLQDRWNDFLKETKLEL